INQDNLYLLLAAIAAFGSLFWLIIIELFNIEIKVPYPFDLIIATICFSMYWFKQYFRIFDESQRLSTKLQEADKKKDEFLMTVAHEMRNPINGILNISQSVVEREKETISKKSSQDLELVVDVGRR